jgi:hypothetical protein
VTSSMQTNHQDFGDTIALHLNFNALLGISLTSSLFTGPKYSIVIILIQSL